jgi:uncharacterized RDD family membrane protein YckC
MNPVTTSVLPSPKNSCLECEAPLSSVSMGGLCPKCLLKLGLHETADPETVGAAASKKLVPPPHFPFDFGGYRIWRLLGRGGMGAVYEADQRSTGRRVALKVLGNTFGIPEARKRFLREGMLAAKVNHPNSVYVFGTDEVEGTPMIVMELVRGVTLKEVLRDGPMEPGKAVDAILQVIAGLEAAAQQGVLHRDIKPANCFQTTEGEVKVGDYGLSISCLALDETALTKTDIFMGTPGFASPEQLRGENVDVRSDIYSVGATLYALLTRHAPFEAENGVQVVAKVLEHSLTPIRKRVPSLPVGLAQIVEGCLSMRPETRFPDYSSLRNALQPYASHRSEPAPLGLRFSASLIDAVFLIMIWQACCLIAVVLFGEPASNLFGTLPARALGCAVGFYAALDGLGGGRTLGRMMLGLRLVLGASPMALASEKLSRIGRLQALVSTSWFRTYPIALFRSLLLYGPLLLFLKSPLPTLLQTQGDFGACVSFLLLAITAVLPFCTARRRNGYAGWHDLLTQTRVVRLPAPDTHREIPSSDPLPSEPTFHPSAELIGPFRTIRSLDSSPPVWKEAMDHTLNRRVWVRLYKEQAPALCEERRSICRMSRLRWIAGMRSASENWDAYEAPTGNALAALEPRPWKAVRKWLLDLIQEARIATTEGTLPAAIGLEHIRVRENGTLLLLDEALVAEPDRQWDIRTVSGIQRFLSAFCAKVLDPDSLPLHAREFLGRLQEQRFNDLLVLEGNLVSLSNRLTEVPRNLRRTTCLLLGLGAFLFAALETLPPLRTQINTWNQRMNTYGEYAPLAKAACVTRLISLQSAWDSKGVHGFEWVFNRNTYFGISHADLKTWIRGNYGNFLASPQFESDPRFSSWTSAEKNRLLTLAQTPEPDTETLRRLDDELLPVLTTPAFPRLMGLEFLATQAALFSLALRTLIVLGCLSILDLAYILCIGRSPIQHLMGLDLIGTKGARAGRARLTLRWVLQQSYFGFLLGTGVLFKQMHLAYSECSTISVDMTRLFHRLSFTCPGFCLPWGIWGFILLMLPLIVMGAFAFWSPRRGLADWLCGTRMVRR